MQFRDKDLRGVPVFTKSGDKIGKLVGFLIDTNQHTVAQYLVSRSRLISRILPEELSISPSQVISLDVEKMVVDDMVIMVEAAAAAMRMGETTV